MSDNNQAVSILQPRLPVSPEMMTKYDVNEGKWRVLCETAYPGAKSPSSILMVLDYCKSQNLDPLKRVVHIVPMWSSTANGGRGGMVETVWPGIALLRTIAHRTGVYAGCDEVKFGPDVTKTFEGMVGRRNNETKKTVELTFPEWARFTVYRIVSGVRCSFPGPKIYWEAIYGQMGKSEVPNDKWEHDPYYMLEKCAEGASLRRAFPEELGGQNTVDEMEGKTIDADPMRDVTPEEPTEAKPEPAKEEEGKSEPKADDNDEELYVLYDPIGETAGSDMSPAAWSDAYVELITAVEKAVDFNALKQLNANNKQELDRLEGSQHKEGCWEPVVGEFKRVWPLLQHPKQEETADDPGGKTIDGESEDVTDKPAESTEAPVDLGEFEDYTDDDWHKKASGVAKYLETFSGSAEELEDYWAAIVPTIAAMEIRASAAHAVITGQYGDLIDKLTA